jgi:hypothetical protein
VEEGEEWKHLTLEGFEKWVKLGARGEGDRLRSRA